MNLKAIVEKYLASAGGFGRPVAFADFGLDRVEIERIFGGLDEDYHISRYFHFAAGAGAAYNINGFAHTHVSIDAEIQSAL